MNKLWRLINTLGPGMLYAGTAVGVSHLVQSTRAGGLFGTQLIWAILIANLFKYTFFEIGPRYAAMTGKTLLHGYFTLHRFALITFVLMTLLTMFTTLSSIVLVTSGILQQLLHLPFDIFTMCIFLLALSFCIIFFGGFDFLNRSVKYIVLTLCMCTIICSILLFFSSSPVVKDPSFMKEFSFSNNKDIFFLIALMGWMPAPLELSVWHSIWETEKNHQIKSSSIQNVIKDFQIGYFSTIILAVLFLYLGSQLMYGTSYHFPDNAIGFAKVIVELYTNTMGMWTFPIVAIAAFSAMFSTTLTCLDAFPKVFLMSYQILSSHKTVTYVKSKKLHGLCLMLTVMGTICCLYLFSQNMKTLVDFTTIISFLTAPLIALFNYYCYKKLLDKEHSKMTLSYQLLSILGIFYLIGFSMFFLLNID